MPAIISARPAKISQSNGTSVGSNRPPTSSGPPTSQTRTGASSSFGSELASNHERGTMKITSSAATTHARPTALGHFASSSAGNSATITATTSAMPSESPANGWHIAQNAPHAIAGASPFDA